MVAAGCLVATMATAAEPQQSLATPEATATFYTFPGTPAIAISRNGNLVRYEGPDGFEHIAVGALSEGYVLCYGSARAYDTGTAEFGFGAASASCSGTACTITRTTSDGRMRLVQRITKGPAFERALNIEMTLTNQSGINFSNVVLRRQVDFDVDTGGRFGTRSFRNRFAATERDSVTAWNAPGDNVSEDHAMLLRRYKTTSPAAVAKVTGSILDNTCSPANVAPTEPVRGDFGATIQYDVGTLTTGRSVVLGFQYQRN
jgi:hypothetical protein